MADKSVKGFPNVPRTADAEMRKFLQTVRDNSTVRFGLSKNQLDRSPTVRELQDAGLIKPSTTGRNLVTNSDTILDIVNGVENATDYVAPDAPNNVSFTVSQAGVLISWTLPSGPAADNISHAEIWRVGPIPKEEITTYPVMSLLENPDGTFVVRWVNQAEIKPYPAVYLSGISSRSMFVEALPPSSHFFYWVRFISHNTLAGPWHALPGTRVDSSVDAQAYLDVLDGQIDAAFIQSALQDSAIVTQSLFEDHELLQRIRDLGDLANSKANQIFTSAEVLTEETTRASETSALAVRATALEATVDDPTTGLTARATALEQFKTYVEDQSGAGYLANASYITGLEATVNGHTANWVSQASVNATFDGRTTGRYFNRIDLDGRITGLEYFDGVGNLQSTSSFIIRADTFQIRTTGTDKVPFAVNGDTISMDVDVIELAGLIPDANIGSVRADKITITGLAGVSTIADAIIDTGDIGTLMIAGEAVSIPAGETRSAADTLSTNWIDGASVTVDWGAVAAPSAVLITAMATAGSATAKDSFRIRLMDGANASNNSGVTIQALESGNSVYTWKVPGVLGQRTYKVQARTDANSSMVLFNSSITVIGTRR